MPSSLAPHRRSTLSLLRQGLGFVLLVGLVGMDIELFLLKHTDGAWEWAPIVLIGVSLLTTLWYAVTRSAASVRALQILMILFVVSGGVGILLHFRGNVSYEKESNPSLTGRELYQSAVRGSTPTLAPGAMIQLGLVGLLFTFRHPSLRSRSEDELPSETQERNES